MRSTAARWGFIVAAAVWTAASYASDVPLDHPSGTGGEIEGVVYGPRITDTRTTAKEPAKAEPGTERFYPSHYGARFYSTFPLRLRPYAIVYNAVKVGRARVVPAGAVVQPFIRGFGDGASY